MADGSGDGSLIARNRKLRLPSGQDLEYQQNNGCYSSFCHRLGELHLNDFPLGDGFGNKSSTICWKTTDFRSYDPQREGIDELKDISNLVLYDFDNNWSKQVVQLRQESIQHARLITPKFVHDFFVDLRLSNEHISHIDPALRKLKNLKKLTLSNTHRIKKINFDNLPKNLEQFNFIACGLEGLAGSMAIGYLKPYSNLIHLSLAMNKLNSEDTDPFLTKEHFPNLISLDLSDNRLTNHIGLVLNLKQIENLNGLNLSDNPISYFTSFNFFSVAALDLDFFNDEAVSIEMKDECSAKAAVIQGEDSIQVTIGLETLTGLKSDEFGGDVSVQITCPCLQSHRSQTFPVSSKLQIMESLDFTFSPSFASSFYQAVRGEIDETFKVDVNFKKSAEPAKKGKKDVKGKKDDKGKGKKGSKGGSAKSSRPESQQEENVEEERVLFSSHITLKDMCFSSQYRPVYLGGAPFNSSEYCRPPVEKDTPVKVEKGKKGGKKAGPKEDNSGPQPIVLNVEIQIRQD